MQTLRITTLALLTTTVSAVLPETSAAPLPQLTTDHADLGVAYEDDELELHIHAHAGAVVDGVALTGDEEYFDGEIEIVLPDNAATRIMLPVDFAALDALSGDDVWVLSQSNQQTQQPFLGLAAEEISGGVFDGPITVSLVDASGPTGGEFALWQVAGLGDLVFYMSTVDGFATPNAYGLSIGGHDHANWGFSAPGLYELTFRATGTLADSGQTVTSEDATFAFRVIPEPASLAMATLGGGAMLLRRRLV